MKIPRTQVVDHLFDFCCEGSGLLVGDPGIGKTWTLKAVRDRARDKNIPCICIGIDTVHAETEEQLVPYFKGDFVAYLQKQTPSSGPAILILDGFDAARSDAKRNLFLRLIQRTLHELKSSWTVCVSVRTFDAQKSLDLSRMFATRTGGTGHPRQTAIPPLSEQDITEALQADPPLRAAYERASKDLKTILTNPFNLWLLEQVCHTNGAIDLTNLRTAVELLNLFWIHRVRAGSAGDKREHLLHKIADDQVRSRQLISRKEQVYEVALDDPWQDLFSANILMEAESGNGDIRFSHNILFDYAIARLLIPSQAAELETFLRSDPTRHLFLRPSLIYHFEGQFHHHRQLFWQNYFESCNADNSILTPLTRLIFPTVLVTEASDIEDFFPLLTKLRDGETEAIEGVVNLLRAMRALTSNWASLDGSKTHLWGRLLKEISLNLNERYAWDVGIINGQLIGKSGKTSSIVDFCGVVARAIFVHAWASREPMERWNFRLASVWGIPQTCLTFATSPEESKRLLIEVLDLIEVPQFPIECLSALCTNIGSLFETDPSFAGIIYQRVFSYTETSIEKTQMGGPVMPMISDRRQDYSMCEYHLLENFHTFVSGAPLVAIEAGIQSLSHWILRSHVEPYLNPGVTVESLREPFTFSGQPAIYIQDLSHIWDRGAYPDQELRIANDIDAYLETLVSEGQIQPLENALRCYGRNSEVALFWSRLLEMGSRNPEIFAKYLHDVCVAYPVLLGVDTTDAVSVFIGKAFAFWDVEQKRKVEEAIVKIPQQPLEVENPEKILTQIQRRLLRGISGTHLVTDAARELIDQEQSPSGQDFDSKTGTTVGWSKVTLDESLEIHGVETTAPQNRDVLKPVHKIEEILRDNQNKDIDSSTVDELILLSKDLERILASLEMTHPAVVLQAETQLAAVASKILRYGPALTDEQLDFASYQLLRASRAQEPLPDPERDAAWDHPYWSPLPRTEAAQGIVALIRKSPKNQEAIAALWALTRDDVPSIRFLTLTEIALISSSHKDLFIAILRDRVAAEGHPVVLDGLCRPLYQTLNWQEIRDQVKILIEKIRPENSFEYHADLIAMLVDMHLRKIEQWPAHYLTSWISKPKDFCHLLHCAARRLSDYIRPARTDELTQFAIIQLRQITAMCIEFFMQRIDGKTSDADQKTARTLYSILDDTIMQLRTTLDSDIRRRRKEAELTKDQIKAFFPLLRPILDDIAIFGANPAAGLHASTAHRFIELMHAIVGLFPFDVLSLSAKVVQAGKGGGYHFDSLGVKEIVEIVEELLADHREVLRDEVCLGELLSILDTFASAGWPEALRLVWRLDEVYR